MIKYVDANLEKTNVIFRILQGMAFFNPQIIKSFWDYYIKIATNAKRIIGSPDYNNEVNQLNVLCIRNNTEISFNTKEFFYNDILIVMRNGIDKFLDEIYIYKVTADPRGVRDNIAHLLEGIYDSYVIRNHSWMPGRTAFCQDRNEVLVARTDSKGNIKRAEPYKGFFGINIHDSSIYQNSSLGCTVLEPDSRENNFHFENSFKPLLLENRNQKRIVYLVTNNLVVSRFLLGKHIYVNKHAFTKINF